MGRFAKGGGRRPGHLALHGGQHPAEGVREAAHRQDKRAVGVVVLHHVRHQLRPLPAEANYRGTVPDMPVHRRGDDE